MSDNEPVTEIDTDALEKRTDRHHYLGTDAKGRRHYVDAQLGAVWVAVDGEIPHIERTHDVSGWVEFTADHVGWRNCTYSDEPLDEWLAAELAEAM